MIFRVYRTYFVHHRDFYIIFVCDVWLVWRM